MADYTDLNLNDNLISNASPLASSDYTNSLEFGLNTQIPLGAIDYSNMVKASKTYTAVISLAKTQGAFQDFQEAFNYVNQQGGGRILVLPGQYIISKILTIYGNTSLEGVGANVCTIDFNSGANNLTTTGGDINISNLTINNSTNSNGAIYLNGASRVLVSKCLFGNNTIDVYALSTGVVYVKECISGIFSNGSGIFFKSSSTVNRSFLLNNSIFFTTGNTFQTDSGAIDLKDSLISTPGTTVVAGTWNVSTISGNRISNATSRCIDISQSGTLTISNNMGLKASQFGTCSDLTITGNVLNDTAAVVSGLNLINCQYVGISGNDIRAGTNNGIDGVRLASGCTRVAITGNSIQGGVNPNGNATEYGVNIADSTCNRFAVVGNIINGLTGNVNNAGSSVGTVDINVLA